jgi:stalled ribosome rescue protein Dom34
MKGMKTKKGYKRGYPVSLLIGFKHDGAMLWEVFSHVVKPQCTLRIEESSRDDQKALYNFHESIIKALKPYFGEGVRSTVIVAPPRTNYGKEFLEHVRKHHYYLIEPNTSNRVIFTELDGSAVQPNEVAELVKTLGFRESVEDVTSAEANGIIRELEKTISCTNETSQAIFSLKEIEEAIYKQDSSQESEERYLVLTDKYLANATDKKRIHRLLQISNNKKVKTRIVNGETPAGKRISQFGGIILFDFNTKRRIRTSNRSEKPS